MTAFSETVTPAQRMSLLARVPLLASLPGQALEALTAGLAERHHPSGSIIVTEGEVGDRIYLIANGRAEVSVMGPGGALPVATLAADELFGEIALLAPDAKRRATVTALTPLLTLSFARLEFEQLLDAHPKARVAFAQAAEASLTANFLKQASPFTTLGPARLRSLATRLEPLTVPAGSTIIRQGEPGDGCYLLRAGRVEVWTKNGDDAERRLAALGPGTLFGEAALLTDAPRNATVRALEPCELLFLRRADLLEAIGADRQVGAQMIELLNFRNCPRQAPGIIAQQRVDAGGETITVLKNPRQGTYYQLSLQGLFLWQRLDGRNTVRDLMLDYLGHFKAFAPQVIAEVVGGLVAAGFVESQALRADVAEAAFRLSPWQRGVLLARRLLEWQVSLRNIDTPITRLYRGGFHLLYTRTSQLILAGVSLLGILAFIVVGTRAQAVFESVQNGKLWLFLIPAYLIAILVHEAGHAFTTKFFGYAVPRAGVGWYWFGPIAFVDTSDMWRAGRWPRIAVSLAGPYTNVAIGSVAAITAWGVSDPLATGVLWQFALTSYALALINLNPLLEYDGYYILMDWLERPNLRPRALAWLGTELPKAMRGRGDFRGHRLELVYGLGSLLFILLMGVLTVIFYRLLVQDWMARLIPATIAEALAWVLAAAVVGLSIANVAGELHHTPLRSTV